MTIITVIVTIVLIFIRIYIDYIGNIQLNGFTDSLYYYFKSYSHVLLGFSIFLAFLCGNKNKYKSLFHKFKQFIISLLVIFKKILWIFIQIKNPPNLHKRNLEEIDF